MLQVFEKYVLLTMLKSLYCTNLFTNSFHVINVYLPLKLIVNSLEMLHQNLLLPSSNILNYQVVLLCFLLLILCVITCFCVFVSAAVDLDLCSSNIQDAFVIAVEPQARERLERLSTLKRVTPVDITKLQRQVGVQCTNKNQI